MSLLSQRLNLKNQTEILVLNAPESFEPELAALDGVAVVQDIYDVDEITFSLAFVTTQEEVDKIAKAIATKVKGGAIVWFAYPKGTSKRYKCEFDRDTGWTVLGEMGFEGVRQVAIDQDWEALRFRRANSAKQ